MPVLTYQALFDVPLPPQVPLVALADQIIPLPQQPPHPKYRSPEFGDPGNEAFYPWANDGWEVQPPQPPHPKYRSPETGDAGNELLEGLFWYNDGWEVQPWQPPHPKYRSPEPGDPGSTEAKLVALNYGFEIQPWQPPHPRYRSPEPGDQGDEAPFILWFNYGWDVQSVQPGHPKYRSPEIGDQGNEAVYQQWYNAGWEVQSFQPPHIWRHSPEPGDPGNEGPVVISTAVPLNYGFEIQPVQPPHIWRHSPEIGDPGNEAPYIFWSNAGWEIQSVQPPYFPSKKPAAIFPRDDGTQAALVQFLAGWEVQSVQPPSPVNTAQRRTATRGNTAFAFYPPWVNSGWEVQSVQPPSLGQKLGKLGGIVPKEDGTEAVFVPPTAIVNWWGELPPWQPPAPIDTAQRRNATRGKSEFARAVPPSQVFLYPGWEVQPWQPIVQPSRKPAAQFTKDEVLFLSVPVPLTNGWTDTLFQPQHPYSYRGAIAPKEDGTEAPFVRWINSGWEVQPPQPPFKPRLQPAATFPKDDGNQAPYIFWFNAGWEIQPPQPPAKPLLRPAAVFPKSDGNEGIFFPQAPVPFFWWAEPTASQPLHVWRKDPEFGDQGNQAPYILWKNVGWEVQPPQPPAKPRLNPAAVFPKEDGTEAAFIPPQAVAAQWWAGEAVWPQPRTQISTAQRRNATRGKSEFAHAIPPANTFVLPFVEFFPLLRKVPNQYKFSVLDRGDDGTQDRYQFWKNWGWEYQSVQPPRIRAADKSNILIRGDDGTQRQLINWFNMGWEVQPWQPPHRYFHSPDDGNPDIDVPFHFVSVNFNDYGWDVQSWQPVLSRYLNRAAIMPIAQGIEGVGSLIPFIVPSLFFEEDLPDIPHPRYRTPEFGDGGFELPLTLIWTNAGWEVQAVQPPYRRYEAPDIGAGGIEKPFFFSFPVPFGSTGWAVQDVQPPYPIRTGQRREATRGNTLFAFYPRWTNLGFEIQPVQPPYGSTVQQRAKGAEGLVHFGAFPQYILDGWESIQPDLRQRPFPRQPTIGDPDFYRFQQITITPVPLVQWDMPATFVYSRGRLLNQHLAALIENNALPYPPGTITASTIKEWIIRARRRGRR